ncbi:MAG: glycosyltransferase family 4 protein [Planctomycetota bacterium]|jgi:glycosyltransferase involved in cell wall biosynthesis
MKFLWTISNWKRTGPLEPSLDLAAAVAAAGHDVRVAVGRPPPGREDQGGLARRARDLSDAGAGVRLAKHAFFLRDRPDARRLAGWIARERPDVIVTTLPNDHRIASRAARASGVPVVRLFFADGERAPPRRDLVALRRASRIAVFGDRPRRRLEASGISATQLFALHPPLDVDGLRARVGDVTAARAGHGVPAATFLFGIVARLQTHRRFERLWAAVRDLAVGDTPPFHLLVVGRGTHQETVAIEPVRRLGIASHVTFTGYLVGEAYATTLAALDAQLFLVPGSDPTCRALREGMALGVPSLTTRRGLLPAFVEDRVTGYLVDEDAASLTAAMRAFAADPEAARRMGGAAARRADEAFRADRAAAQLIEVVGAL